MVEDISVYLKAVLHISQGIVPEHRPNKQAESNTESELKTLEPPQLSRMGYSVVNT